MPTQNRSPQTRNQLWLARKNIGLEQKQVAFLLGHRTPDQISRYEKGLCLPSLKILLQLEIIYGLPTRLLYPDYYEQLAQKIAWKAADSAALQEKLQSRPKEHCFFLDLLNKKQLTKEDHMAYKKHVIQVLHSTPEKSLGL